MGLRTNTSRLGHGGGFGGVTPGLADEDAALFGYTAGDATTGATFTNASANRSFTNVSGVIQYAGVNVLRDAHYINGVRTTLLEGSRTNLLLRSEEFDNASWAKNGATVTANSAVAPNGATVADTVARSSDGVETRLRQTTTQANATTYTLYVYAKPATSNFLRLRNIAVSGGPSAWFNVSTGTIGTVGVGLTATISAVGNGFYRGAITGTTEASIVSNLVDIAPAASDNQAIASGTAGESVYIWHSQLEAGAFPSSPIPTTSATVTRALDSLPYTLGNYANWTRWEWFYNSAGVLTEAVMTGTGSYSFTPAVDRAYRKIVIAKETRDVAYFAGYK